MAKLIRFVRVFAHTLKAASLVICLPLTACASGSSTAPKLLNALKAEQQANHIVIGYENGNALEYIDTTAENVFRRVSLTIHTQSVRSIELRGAGGVATSSDGKWVASCSDKSSCTISEKSDSRKRFSVSRKNVLTALYWSPDDKFVFLVEKAPKWRLPVRCPLEDERDVTVYEIATGTNGVLITVCGGFPYGSLSWYELSAP